MKLTKAETKRHEECLSLLSLGRILKFEEREFVYTHFHPGATNNIGKGGIFFTPECIAVGVAIMVGDQDNRRVLDACAGIGRLSWEVWSRYGSGSWNDKPKITAVELNPELFDVGKKLLPEIEWVRGDIFDSNLLDSLGFFHVGVSNPPYGNAPTASAANRRTQYKGPAHFCVAEVLLKRCKLGGIMVIPYRDGPQQSSGSRGERPQLSSHYTKFLETFPETAINECPFELSCTCPGKYPDEECPVHAWKGTSMHAVIIDVNGGDPGNAYYEGPGSHKLYPDLTVAEKPEEAEPAFETKELFTFHQRELFV